MPRRTRGKMPLSARAHADPGSAGLAACLEKPSLTPRPDWPAVELIAVPGGVQRHIRRIATTRFVCTARAAGADIIHVLCP